eukprot:TRINITY_DN2349_c0_g1_i2.p1 TRINITY_DN2349_c0_g1~~TRINITY_DN2349_c0_g1_i2.p1  ORF type:complete len:425 (+),score=167.98 TRINITY_DN2349_c0_g1_i2:96-1370(+)
MQELEQRVVEECKMEKMCKAEMARLDLNRDGVVDLDEFARAGGVSQQFVNADKNQDGVLDKQELARVMTVPLISKGIAMAATPTLVAEASSMSVVGVKAVGDTEDQGSARWALRGPSTEVDILMGHQTVLRELLAVRNRELAHMSTQQQEASSQLAAERLQNKERQLREEEGLAVQKELQVKILGLEHDLRTAREDGNNLRLQNQLLEDRFNALCTKMNTMATLMQKVIEEKEVALAELEKLTRERSQEKARAKRNRASTSRPSSRPSSGISRKQRPELLPRIATSPRDELAAAETKLAEANAAAAVLREGMDGRVKELQAREAVLQKQESEWAAKLSAEKRVLEEREEEQERREGEWREQMERQKEKVEGEQAAHLSKYADWLDQMDEQKAELAAREAAIEIREVGQDGEYDEDEFETDHEES